MSFVVKGRIIEILPEQFGVSSTTGSAWNKRDFVIEEQDVQYPKRIAFTAFNKANIFNFFGVYDEVTVSFNAESKEYQGRWFTNLTVWKVDVDVKAAGSVPAGSGAPITSYPPPPPPPPDEEVPAATEGTADDLPF